MGLRELAQAPAAICLRKCWALKTFKVVKVMSQIESMQSRHEKARSDRDQNRACWIVWPADADL